MITCTYRSNENGIQSACMELTKILKEKDNEYCKISFLFQDTIPGDCKFSFKIKRPKGNSEGSRNLLTNVTFSGMNEQNQKRFLDILNQQGISPNNISRNAPTETVKGGGKIIHGDLVETRGISGLTPEMLARLIPNASPETKRKLLGDKNV